MNIVIVYTITLVTGQFVINELPHRYTTLQGCAEDAAYIMEKFDKPDATLQVACVTKKDLKI